MSQTWELWSQEKLALSSEQRVDRPGEGETNLVSHSSVLGGMTTRLHPRHVVKGIT